MATWCINSENDFSYHFKKIIVRYKEIGYDIDVLRQTACLVVYPIRSGLRLNDATILNLS